MENQQKKNLAELIKISSNGRFPEVSERISNIFTNKKSLYFLFLGHKTQDINLMNNKLEAEMTSEMHNYRHIIHPFKLSIMNLLFTNPKISSIEVRNRLGLSMSEYYNTIRSLEKRKFIQVFDDFGEDGSTRQFVMLEDTGRDIYSNFIKLIGRYTDKIKDFIPDYDGTDLYP